MQPLRIEARFARPLNFADFDKKSMRKGFIQVGRDVSKIAKKLVSKKEYQLPELIRESKQGYSRKQFPTRFRAPASRWP